MIKDRGCGECLAGVHHQPAGESEDRRPRSSAIRAKTLRPLFRGLIYVCSPFSQLDSTVPVSQDCTLWSGFLTLEALESRKLNLEGFRKGFVAPGSGWCHCPNPLQAFKSSIHTANKNRPTA